MVHLVGKTMILAGGEVVVEKPQLFSNFVGGINSLLYLHKFVYQFPDVLSKVFQELPKRDSGNQFGIPTLNRSSRHLKRRNEPLLSTQAQSSIEPIQC